MSVVFFCMGATKAGTSWLHRQLQRHPQCHFRSLKELHYFDALERGTLQKEFDRHEAMQRDLLNRLASRDGVPTGEQSRRLQDRRDWLEVLHLKVEDRSAYIDYLQKGAGTARVVGDLTPAYALLPTRRMRAMASMAEDVRALYILRDPVERLWSHVRMIAGRRDPEGVVTRRRADQIFDRVLAGEESQISDRSNYARALRRIGNAFAASHRLFDVFEEMILKNGLGRLWHFLGLSQLPADPAPVHAGQALAMTAAQRQAAANWLAPQYDAAYAALGRKPEAWAWKG